MTAIAAQDNLYLILELMHSLWLNMLSWMCTGMSGDEYCIALHSIALIMCP
jgi:hypothetical protein